MQQLTFSSTSSIHTKKPCVNEPLPVKEMFVLILASSSFDSSFTKMYCVAASVGGALLPITLKYTCNRENNQAYH